MSSSVPDRTADQRRTALAHANAIRTYRAQTKARIAAGTYRFPSAAAYADPLLATAKVYDLLRAVPVVGRSKAARVLTLARITPSKTVGSMSQRQRDDLVVALAAVSPGSERRITDLIANRRAA